jgi:hypothetical protein
MMTMPQAVTLRLDPKVRLFGYHLLTTLILTIDEDYVSRHLQTDIYATWDDVFDPMCADAWNGTLFA